MLCKSNASLGCRGTVKNHHLKYKLNLNKSIHIYRLKYYLSFSLSVVIAAAPWNGGVLLCKFCALCWLELQISNVWSRYTDGACNLNFIIYFKPLGTYDWRWAGNRFLAGRCLKLLTTLMHLTG